jgi:hypothetical protein
MTHGGIEYLGEFFDRRLIVANIRGCWRQGIRLDALFRSLTSKIKHTKYFLGIDRHFIEIYNARLVDGLREYSHPTVVDSSGSGFTLLDADGIAIFKSIDGADPQMERLFPDEEVKRRLGHYVNFIDGKAKECGAPCRSREREGLPCKIKTFRGHCHFHR